MTRFGQRPSSGSRRRRWPGAIAATSLLLTVLVWVADGSDAQTEQPFTITVSKVNDLVSGETIEVNVNTTGSTVVFPGAESEVRTCRAQDADYTAAQFDNVGSDNCVINKVPLSPFDESVDNDFLHRFPDNGPGHGQRAIAILRPGQGTANWQQAGEHSLTCDTDHPCQLVFRLHIQTGTGNPQTVVYSRPDLRLAYRPDTGVAGCDGPAAGAIESGMPDRLQDAWLDWTRSVCQTSGGDAPTNAFFQTEGEALASFGSGNRDLAFSGVAYRPGFDPPTKRPMVPVPVALNAVVLAVGGGYTVQDGTWPSTLPRPAEEFRLTNAEVATLLGQLQSIYVSRYAADVLARNPVVPSELDLSNFNAGSAPLALTGAQSTTLFASTYLDTLAPAQWTDPRGVARGVETDLNRANPTHGNGGLDLKTGRPDLARIVYRNLYLNGTYYVLTDLATATALGLTPVTLQNAAGDWVAPTPETMAAAVPSMKLQNGTLAPDPTATTGYPLTFVEYAMAPLQRLVTPQCAPRPASQELLADWLEYITTDGQSQLAGNGLVALPPSLAQQAATQRIGVGLLPGCTTTPPTSNPTGGGGTTTTTSTPPASVTDPGGVFGPDDGSGPGSGSGSDFDSDDDLDNLAGNGGARPSRTATPSTREEASRAAQEAEIELPDVHGIRSINAVGPPLALLIIVALSTMLALSTAGYPAPAAVARLPGRARRGLGAAGATVTGLVRRGARRSPPATGAAGETPS